MIYKNRILVSLIAMIACILISTVAVAEQNKPSATVSISSHEIAFGIGISWGHGTLKFKGKEYKFKIHGLSVVDLGISGLDAAGEVYNLRYLSDFAGTYMAASAGMAIAGGAGATVLENQNDVVLHLKSTKQGVQFTLAAEGLRVKLLE